MCIFMYICVILLRLLVFLRLLLFVWDIAIFVRYCYFLRYCCFRHLPSYKFPGPLQTSPSRRVSMIEPIFKSFRGTRAKTSTETFKNPVRRPISGHPPIWDYSYFLRYCYVGYLITEVSTLEQIYWFVNQRDLLVVVAASTQWFLVGKRATLSQTSEGFKR